ncbi:MAG TPA: histidinol dehydrogenase [Terriglobales bacterium]|jgi:histidinol dehydrogenase|nr:histidinol dehydrogenase [Terriglobales bacterium]
MRLLKGRAAEQAVARFAARGSKPSAVNAPVRRIVREVRDGDRAEGERAVRRYAERWDGLVRGQPIRVPDAELEAAGQFLTPEFRRSLRQAAANIRCFCEWQKPVAWTRNRHGICLGQIVAPLDSVGCYVPGGRYPLVSTLLMTVIPAQVAGVKNIRVVSPRPSLEVLGAARMLGVAEFYRVGGAHAIAALAYGTKSIPRVDKIVGPGNAYVTAAKKLVSFDCAIDFLAGPTEAVVLSESGKPPFIASDLVAQAEHDADALGVFITCSRPLADAVVEEIKKRVKNNPVARQSLRNGAILLANSRDQGRVWANRIAPEHITVDADDLPFIHNAGSIFVGDHSPQAAGDYASGPNHVLPTAGQARFRGGLSVLDFVKIITVQQLSPPGLGRIARTVECLAQAEGLSAHAHSITVRSNHA